MITDFRFDMSFKNWLEVFAHFFLNYIDSKNKNSIDTVDLKMVRVNLKVLFL